MLNHVGTQRIETNRLILRQHKITDAEDIFNNYASDAEVSRFFNWGAHKSIDETIAFLENKITKYAKPNKYHWLIELKSISQAVGFVDLTDIDDANDSVSVVYALSRKYWNQGITTEACKSVLDFAFTVLKAKTVSAYHHIDNAGSGSVMKKCGMRYVKTEYKNVPDYEEISGDHCYYEIYVDEGN